MFSSLLVVVALPLIAEVLDRVCARTHAQKKEIAAALGYSQPYLSRVLSGEKPLNVEALRRLDRTTLQAFGEALIDLAGGEPPLTASMLRAELDARFPRATVLRLEVGARKAGVA